MLAEAALLTVFVIFGNTFLRRFVNIINQIPINEETGEATYEIRLTRNAVPELRELVVDMLNDAYYPVSDVELYDMSDDRVELIVTLVSTAIDIDEIETVVNKLEHHSDVYHANWESSTRE